MLVTDRRDGVAALNGAGGAGRRGLAAAALEGGGGRKKGQRSKNESSDVGEHHCLDEENADWRC